VFQLTQQKLSFNSKDCGGSKYGLVRNLFKGLMSCPQCNEAIETKNTSYKCSDGTLHHYGHYLCVKSKNGCTNKGRIRVEDFEAEILFSIVHQDIFDQKPVKVNDELLGDGELSDMKELTAKLSTLNNQKTSLQKEIETEKGKSAVLNDAPKAIQVLKGQFNKPGEKLATTIEEAAERVIERAKRGEPKKVDLIKAYIKNEIRKRLSDTAERHRVRNMMSSIIRNISIKFGKTVSANIEFVTGKTITLNIANN
jgi:hypothetical protein